MSLTWTAVTGATSYNVKRANTAGGSYTTLATIVTETNYSDTIITNGTTYYYVVTAVNANGESGNSNEVSVTPQEPQPGSPTVYRLQQTMLK
ncbi:MAG: Amylopullulanase precursor [Pelotomaculum sp. PtaB.Bin013]|nr:MAG: Amylopullulanase precursor [Pelotomaculum sp. PtaB.Bin013]